MPQYAAIAAFRKLKNPILEDFNRNIHTVLPSGETIEIPCQSVSGTFSDEKIEVSATVIKDGGDDPDVTSGLPIVTTLTLNLAEAKQANNAPVQTPETWEFVFHGGPGVGTVTLPGLGLEVGGPAINATPQANDYRQSEELHPVLLSIPAKRSHPCHHLSSRR